MDDILRRLGIVESSVAEIRTDVSAIKAILPHLATKADVAAVTGEISEVRGGINALRGEIKADIHAVETSLIKWIIGTVISSAALAFAIAKFVS